MKNYDDYKLASPPMCDTEEDPFGYCDLCGDEVLIGNLKPFENHKFVCEECIEMDKEQKRDLKMITKKEIQKVLTNEGTQGVTDLANEKVKEKAKEQLMNIIKIVAVTSLIIVGTLVFNKYL